ncbi:MAG: autotransporter-associated beta strand repeat-containing protein [Kiritimatiellae bacterium]|nr:autotransporter-associated beta strand repeat-containing protein [Kiritimatiellia bacterium]
MKVIRDVLLGVSLVCAALSVLGNGVFSVSEPLGNDDLDGSVGLSAGKNYTHAYNIGGADVTINGVSFTGVSNFTGVKGSFAMSGPVQRITGGSVIGAGSGLNTLLNSFNYNGNPVTLALTNLVVGESYILTLYNKAWGPAGARIQQLASSSGAVGAFDQNMGGEPNANLVRYSFIANNITESVALTKVTGETAGNFHLYGFSTERIFNNPWSSGAQWSSSTWGTPGMPNYAGANADFPAQGTSAAIDLDVAVTVGHIQVDGPNSWTLAGTNTLTLQADVAGISVLSALSGSHTISNDIILANGVLKSGSGTLTLAGTLSGYGNLTVGAGTLEITTLNTMAAGTSVEIRANAVMQLSNVETQRVTTLSFDNQLQRRGTWGAIGSGALYTSSRFAGTGILEVLGGTTMGSFAVSANLGGGDLDAAVGLDSGLSYFSAVNTYGGALTINGVPFGGSGGGNPAGVTYATVNFGYARNAAQSVVTGQLGALLNDFNYGNGTTPQSLTLRNLVVGRRYTLTLYNRAWGAYGNRTQIVTTTSGATTTFNSDDGAADTASLLSYTFIASGSTETITMTPTNGNSLHLYGFSVTVELPDLFTDVTRRDSGNKVIADDLFADVRIREGTGAPADITIEKPETTINTLTQSATDDITTLDCTDKILALNSIVSESGAGALNITDGMIKIAGNSLVVETGSSNAVTIASVISDSSMRSDLNKTGTGTLILNRDNVYNGNTTVYDGTLKLTGGKIGSGLLTVDGGTFQLDGGTATSASWENYRNSTVNQTGGTMNHGFYFKSLNTVFNLSGGRSGCGGESLMGVDGGTNVTFNIGGTHIADWLVARFGAGNVILNLNSGGTLLVDEMSNTGANGVIRFDGGTLAVSTRQPGRAPGDWVKAGNSVVIADGGAVINTEVGSVTINRPLLRDGESAGGLTKSGNNTLTLTALGTYAGNTLVAGGTLKVAPTPVLIDLVNASFELPVYTQATPNNWSYLASDGLSGGWVFTKRAANGNCGIAAQGSHWVAGGAATAGTQAGFLQRNANMQQSIYIPVAGSYKLTFIAANRPGKGADDIAVVFGGVTNGFWSAAKIEGGALFKDYSTALGDLQPGSYELNFVGTSPDGADRATAIDDVKISRVAGSLPGSLPAGTHLTLACNTALDLNGANQSLGGLSGSGDVINSSSTNVTISAGSNNLNADFTGNIDGNIALAKVGTGTFVLSGNNTYSGITQVDSGVLRLSAPGVALAVDNASFETHDALDKGSWAYTPTGATWTFAAAGISGPSGIWIASGAVIDGSFAGFIQRTGSISGVINVTHPGWYSVGFLAGKRPGYPAVQLFIEVDGVTQFSVTNSVFTDVGAAFSGAAFLPGGIHTLRFRGYSPPEVDAATWFDRITLTSQGGSLPAETVAVVSADGVLDLNGNDQTLAGVSGNGVVSNGTLAVSGTVAPGGVNNIGDLTLAVTPALSGATLRIDVATDGSGDRLYVQGDLNLSGMTLQVENLEQLGQGKDYTIAECTGSLASGFDSTNLVEPWRVLVESAAGTVKITTYKGTLFLVR